MTIRTYRINRKNSDGSYDAIHPESQSGVVMRPNGHSVEQDLKDLYIITSSLETRMSTLELIYNTDVTGNQFSATFSSLDNVNATGVWNKTAARIEF